jgi:hypothetical protein
LKAGGWTSENSKNDITSKVVKQLQGPPVLGVSVDRAAPGVSTPTARALTPTPKAKTGSHTSSLVMTAALQKKKENCWVMCEVCSKWRRLPPCIKSWPGKFECWMNSTDLVHNTCALPEEDWRNDGADEAQDEAAVALKAAQESEETLDGSPAPTKNAVTDTAANGPTIGPAPRTALEGSPAEKEGQVESGLDSALDAEARAEQEELGNPLPPAPEGTERWIRKAKKHASLPLRLPHWRRIIHRLCCTPKHVLAELLVAVRTPAKRPTGQHRLALEFFEQLLCYWKRKTTAFAAPPSPVWVNKKTLTRLLSWELSPEVLRIGSGAAGASSTDHHSALVQERVSHALAKSGGVLKEFVGRRVAKEFGGKG